MRRDPVHDQQITDRQIEPKLLADLATASIQRRLVSGSLKSWLRPSGKLPARRALRWTDEEA
jgi:hypothetical protein